MNKHLLYQVRIPGNPIVKKNNQKVAIRGRRPVKYNTKAYEAWRNAAKIYLIGAYFDYRLTQAISSPVILECHFHMATRRKVDLSALYEGIQDELVKAGVLVDDNSNIVVGHDGSRVHYSPDDPHMLIKILALEQTGVL